MQISCILDLSVEFLIVGNTGVSEMDIWTFQKMSSTYLKFLTNNRSWKYQLFNYFHESKLSLNLRLANDVFCMYIFYTKQALTKTMIVT